MKFPNIVEKTFGNLCSKLFFRELHLVLFFCIFFCFLFSRNVSCNKRNHHDLVCQNTSVPQVVTKFLLFFLTSRFKRCFIVSLHLDKSGFILFCFVMSFCCCCCCFVLFYFAYFFAYLKSKSKNT